MVGQSEIFNIDDVEFIINDPFYKYIFLPFLL